MPLTQLPLAPVLSKLDGNLEAGVERWLELLRIPSISTDSAYNAQTREAAEWCAKTLSELGFQSSVRDTTGHPMVVAHHPGPGEGNGDVPHVLYYGHYDVQPPDPLELWDSPPFEPVIVDGPNGKRVVARGAVDDKGQLMTFVEAFRAWIDVHGTLPIKVTVLLEGEEESGSPSLDPFLEANKDELAADVCLVSDTGMWDVHTPAVTYMLRGLVYTEVTLHGPSHDLHSGIFGGTVVNPINELCRILGELHDKDGVIQIPGFYDDVLELTDEELAQWNSLHFDEKGFLASAGMKTPYGEKGRSTLERMWSRPTCDINGIIGGYTGKGAKTVLASKVTAKISFRLVPDQDPKKVYAGLQKFLNDRTPPDCKWEIRSHGLSPAIRVPTESAYLEATLAGLKQTFGRDPILMGCGGSIPVVGSIQRILGFDSLLVGFGLEDDRMHSPNEKFEMKCFDMGRKAHAAILAAYAELNS